MRVPWRRIAWPRGLREAVLAAAIALGIIGFPGIQDIALVRGLETASLDIRFRLRGPKPAEPDTIVVLVDDRSLAELGRWPLTRHLYAKAVGWLSDAGAKVIGFDLLFAEREEPLAKDLTETLRAAAAAVPESANPALHQALSRYSGDADVVFAAALKASGKGLLSLAFNFQGKETDGPPTLTDHAFQQLDASTTEPFFPLQPKQVVPPVSPLIEAATGLGHVNIAFDRDGAPRYDYLALPFAGDFIPSLAVRAVAMYRGVAWSDVALALGDHVKIGDITAPTDAGMRFAINYRGPRGTIPTYSFTDLINGRLDGSVFKDRIVLIGASFLGISDAYPGPFGATPVPGTERIANIIDSILARDFLLDSPPPWPRLVIAIVGVLALAIGAAGALLPTRFVALVGVVPIASWAGGAQLAFQHGLWIPAVLPVAAMAAAATAVVLFRYGFVDRQRRQIQNAFRLYLAPDLVDRVADDPPQLGGETRMLTIMFSDIRGFTTISETFKSNPQGLSRLINRGFLTPMTRLIMARQGTIDKYMGDCIMAFWNAPLDDATHADHACESALAMLAELDKINAMLEEEAKAEGRIFHPIHIGLGLNTGECVVGNMGSENRFAYTAMGDAVNLASRLEGQSKTYGLSLIIGETTREAAPSWAALELDLIAVKGKVEAVRIFTLLGDASVAQRSDFRALAEDHAAMLACYRAQDWSGCHTALARCRGRDPRLEELYDLYEDRLAYFTTNPPAPDWDGVFVALSK